MKTLLQHIGDRIEGRILEKRSGRAFEPGIGSGCNFFAKALQQTRFANAGLAYNCNYLTLALAHTLPTIHQQAQLVIAADEWRQAAHRGRCGEAATHPAWTNYAVELERP